LAEENVLARPERTSWTDFHAHVDPTSVFGNMSLDDNTAAAASFVASTKKLRKKHAKSGPETAYQVGMEFCANSPLRAKKALVKF